jgi:glycosyltransferase involved in cell wall biosynthesis
VARRIKVTYFINSLEQGGAERQLAELMTGLDANQFEASLVLCNGTDQLGYKIPADRIRVLDAPMFPTPVSVARLVDVLRELQPDVFHSYMGWENIFGRIAARRAGVRAVVSSVRCTRLPSKHVVGEALTHRMSDAIIVNSVGIRDELVQRARVAAGAIDVVENGVDLARFRPLADQDRRAVRAAWAMDGRRVLVVPGRICAQKNQWAIVQALVLLKQRGKLPHDSKVIFAGRDNHLSYGPRVRALVAWHGLGERVVFAGVVHRIEALVGASDGVLLPSCFEGLPNAVIEAMAVGVPVMVSPAANTDGLVENGVSGIVLEGTSPEAIAQGLESFFEASTVTRSAMAAKGMERTRQRFAMNRMVGRTLAVYTKALKLPSPLPGAVLEGEELAAGTATGISGGIREVKAAGVAPSSVELGRLGGERKVTSRAGQV